MRRIAICLAALFHLLLPTSAQGQVTFTVTGGPNIATWVWPERAERRESWSWHGGALGLAAGVPIVGNWGVQLGIGLSQKGWHGEGRCAAGWETFACEWGKWITYAESTVLADRRVQLSNRFRLHLLAGPALGYQWDPQPQVAARFDFGIAGGARLDTRIRGGLGLSVGALYTHGLKNVHSMDVIEEWKNWYYSKSRTLTLRTGLSYAIG